MALTSAPDQRLMEALSRTSASTLEVRREAACSRFDGADVEALQALIVACDQVTACVERVETSSRDGDDAPGVAEVACACMDVNIRAIDLNLETIIPPALIGELRAHS